MSIDFTSGIARFHGNRNRYRELLIDTAAALPVSINQIGIELKHGHYQEAEHLSHALRGRVGTLGMNTLFERLKDLERVLREEDRAAADVLLADVRKESDRTIAAVTNFDLVTDQIPWQTDYETGIPSIDAQHQALFALVNEISTCPNVPTAELHALIQRLSDYAAVHFEAEEIYLRRIRFSGIEEHMEGHTQFVSELTDASLRLMRDEVECDHLKHFLRDWLLRHVCETDQCLRADPSDAALLATTLHAKETAQISREAGGRVIATVFNDPIVIEELKKIEGSA